MSLGGIAKRIFNSVKLKKRVFDPERISIEDIKLPNIFEDLNDVVITNMVKEELNTYKSLGYNKKSVKSLNICDFHSFQVGVILRYLQLNYDLLISNKEEVFPSIIINSPFPIIQLKFFEIIYNYDIKVPKTSTGAQLINDTRWTPLDMSYLLYYLSTYKETNKLS